MSDSDEDLVMEDDRDDIRARRTLERTLMRIGESDGSTVCEESATELLDDHDSNDGVKSASNSSSP